MRALVAVVVVVVAVQGYLLVSIDRRLGAVQRQSAAAQRRLSTLESRAAALEQQARNAFDPQAVAAAVRTSVYRVEAGDYTGTAFTIAPAPGGGTYLLTNFHVIAQSYQAHQSVALVRSNLRYPATIAKVDQKDDLALLKAAQKFGVLAATTATVTPGEQVVVVGAPLGLEGSVTTGVVSALRNDLPTVNTPVIQFDAPINPGNSGGPVVNGKRQVVGIASAKISQIPGVGTVEGIGFAIPISVACHSFSVC